tara:strand:+ start:194 stop:535 length:342 start_codon:yes stop_codon:yes gene_type:complete
MNTIKQRQYARVKDHFKQLAQYDENGHVVGLEPKLTMKHYNALVHCGLYKVVEGDMIEYYFTKKPLYGEIKMVVRNSDGLITGFKVLKRGNKHKLDDVRVANFGRAVTWKNWI